MMIMARKKVSPRDKAIAFFVTVIFFLSLVVAFEGANVAVVVALVVVVALFIFLIFVWSGLLSWLLRRRRGNTPGGYKIRKPIPNTIRLQVYSRANHRCENPACSYSSNVDIHHIDGNPSNSDINNLIALCPNCHKACEIGKYPLSLQYSWIWEKRK